MGKDLHRSVFFNNIPDLTFSFSLISTRSCVYQAARNVRPETLLKKRLQRSRFPLNFVTFLRTPFYRTRLVAASGLRINFKF